jgi:TetR/AcrR family tetracycline transcriptional repressor
VSYSARERADQDSGVDRGRTLGEDELGDRRSHGSTEPAHRSPLAEVEPGAQLGEGNLELLRRRRRHRSVQVEHRVLVAEPRQLLHAPDRKPGAAQRQAQGDAPGVEWRPTAARLRRRPSVRGGSIKCDPITTGAAVRGPVSKTGLIEDLLDDVLATIQLPDADLDDPSAGLHRLVTSTYEVLLVHTDLVPLYLARQGARRSNVQRLGEKMKALLARAGVHGTAARQALRVLIIHTIGFAAFATRSPIETGAEPRLTTDEMRDNFTDGLTWLLTGITRRSAPARCRLRQCLSW